MTSLNRHGEDIPDPGGDAGAWGTILNNVLQFFDGHTWVTTTVTSDYTANNYEFVVADAGNNNIDITLPTPDDDIVVAIKAVDTSNSLTIKTPGAETIDGDTSLSLSLTDAVRFIHSDGSNYQIATPPDETVNHDDLNGFVSDEHINHANTDITAGNGLSGGGDISSSRTIDAHKINTVSSDTTVSENEYLLVDASGGDRTITLPSPSTDLHCIIKKISDSGNVVNIVTPNAETIDGQTSWTLNSPYVGETIFSDGTDYYFQP
jgi:hypothetical protein